jgi:hypothetical protein
MYSSMQLLFLLHAVLLSLSLCLSSTTSLAHTLSVIDTANTDTDTTDTDTGILIELTVTSPIPNSVVSCNPGDLRAIVPLEVSSHVVSLGTLQPDELAVEVMVDPQLDMGDFVEVVKLSGLDSAGVRLGNLLPGMRTVGIRVKDAAQNIVAETSSAFYVHCDGDTFDTTSVLSSYDSNTVDRAQYFQNVYKYNMWNSDESESGPGSTKEAAANITQLIEEVVSDRSSLARRPTHVFDIPCGDLNWMADLLPVLNQAGVPYTGMDVSRDVVARNMAKYTTDMNQEWMVRFAYLDVVSDPLPIIPVGALVICRHLMIHLSISDNLQILYRLVSSPAHWLLLTTFDGSEDEISDNNRVFPLFLGHNINLLRSPYCLRPPILLLGDNFPAMIGLWDIRSFNSQNAKSFFNLDGCKA